MHTLRTAALIPWAQNDPNLKAEATLALDLSLPVGALDSLSAPAEGPGRAARPVLVPHTQLKAKSMATPEGRAMLVHSIAHIELNAIDLALDVVWRFADMPEAFYTDWVRIAQEEAKHFSLLRQHLLELGFDYGDFPAHNTLWDMAERTKDDILARIGIVPRTMEARGLDASPGVKNKLVSVGDHRAGEILNIILEEEIGHVAAGNRWYRYLCAQRGLDPVSTYAELIAQYDAPKLRPPFNMAARRLAGFEEAELAALS
ncbi:ferritin-like domain-containing protein [Limnohabitans sp. yimb22184]|uniref:ferritin-like domain-containing protein n=1 Tax=Limnohabitans sp. YIMB22184 TaxID=3374104 RepID=UPI003A854DFD